MLPGLWLMLLGLFIFSECFWLSPWPWLKPAIQFDSSRPLVKMNETFVSLNVLLLHWRGFFFILCQSRAGQAHD